MLDLVYNLQGDVVKIVHQAMLNGMWRAAKVTTIKDRHGNETYQATVLNSLDEIIGIGYGDTSYEACDNVKGN